MSSNAFSAPVGPKRFRTHYQVRKAWKSVLTLYLVTENLEKCSNALSGSGSLKMRTITLSGLGGPDCLSNSLSGPGALEKRSNVLKFLGRPGKAFKRFIRPRKAFKRFIRPRKAR